MPGRAALRWVGSCGTIWVRLMPAQRQYPRGDALSRGEQRHRGGGPLLDVKDRHLAPPGRSARGCRSHCAHLGTKDIGPENNSIAEVRPVGSTAGNALLPFWQPLLARVEQAPRQCMFPSLRFPSGSEG